MDDPGYLNRSGDPQLAVRLAHAVLAVAEGAAACRDLATLDWLSAVLWRIIRSHDISEPQSVDFYDINEYVDILDDYVRLGENPMSDSLVNEYRQGIFRELSELAIN